MTEALRQTDPAAAPQFGGRIRALRRKAGLTLQQVADQAGISVGFLSQVERDKATPSLGTLAGLAAALGVEIDWFIAAPRPSDAVTRAGSRQAFSISDSSLRYERLNTMLPGGTLSSLIIHIPPGYRSEVTAHNGEELIVVLDGCLRQTLGATEMDLGPGDSLHFMGDTPHSFANPGDRPARILWTGTSPRLIGKPPERP
jgi:transcriptional regulator with XRE-family HTH domain